MPELAAQPIGVGVIGLGFMGRTHLGAYNAAAAAGLPCRVVAVCDADPSRLTATAAATGNLPGAVGDRPLFDPERTATYTDPAALLADPSVGMVSICTYTDTHVPLALAALAAGKHVLVEKPVAVTAAEARRLADAAARASVLCMPALCMRFWPGWPWVRDRIRDGAFGAVRSATFTRLVGPPRWGLDFYRNPERSGGALCDLHIHDADFIHWCFGRPAAVSTTGTLDHLSTHYLFADGPAHVTAEGGWDLARAAGFRMRYTVIFEHATADFDMARPDPLILHTAEGSEPVELPAVSGYEGQVRHFVQAAATGSKDLASTMAEAVSVAEVLDAERESMTTGRTVMLR